MYNLAYIIDSTNIHWG